MNSRFHPLSYSRMGAVKIRALVLGLLFSPVALHAQTPTSPADLFTQNPIEAAPPQEYQLPWGPWQYTLLGLAILVALLLLFLLILGYRIYRKKSRLKITPIDHLGAAQKALAKIAEHSDKLTLPDLSTKLSLLIRQYLTEARSQPALYQTREEFLAHPHQINDLPAGPAKATDELLHSLQSYQYAPQTSDSKTAEDLLTKTRHLFNLYGIPSSLPLEE